MSFKGPFQNPYRQQGVILAPVSDNIQSDVNLEPPFVRKRHGNLGYCYIDSNGSTGKLNNFTVGQNQASFLFAQKIKRYAMSSIRMAYNVPNVNPYNNQVIVVLGGLSSQSFTFNMPEGYYYKVTDFITQFATSINASAQPITSNVSTFTFTIDPHNPELYTISILSGYTFYFSNQSTMVRYGQYLCNLPTEQVLSTSKGMGSIMLTYTRYIDITSYSLNEYNKNHSTSDGLGKNNLLFRLYETPTGLDQNGNFMTFSKDRFISRTNLSWINYERDKSLSVIDIQIYDEFGNLLYIPTYPDRPSDFYIMFEILTEL